MGYYFIMNNDKTTFSSHWDSFLKIFRPNHRKVRANQYLAHLAIIPAVMIGSLNWFIFSVLVFYIFHGVGSGCGAHRYFTHKSFKAKKWAEAIMAFFFTLASSGSVIGYVLIHNKHHRNSDAEGDPHNPRVSGYLKTWLGILDKQNLTVDPRAYMRLRTNSVLRVLHDYYFLFIALYIVIITACFGFKGLIFLYCLPVVLQFHANSALIVLCHSNEFGYRNFDTPDRSKNLNPFFKFFLLGEELHNNHHYRAGSATVNIKNHWLEFDPLYALIKFVLSTGG